MSDTRDYPAGNSNAARLQRWLVEHKTDESIRQAPEPGSGEYVTMTGGDLYDLLFEVTEWAYGNGVDDVRERHGIR